MFRRGSFFLCTLPIVGRTSDSSSLSVPGSAHSRPLILNSSFSPRDVVELAAKEEERRLARVEKLFENMLVFQGGAMKDHETLGKKLIMRDFVHYAMYHHKWGYHPKLARKYRELMTTGFFDPIPFGNLRSQYDYEEYVARLSDATPTFPTPASIFQPFYGWALAEYMITTMRAKFHPSEPLIIYDVGAGAGNLAVSMLDFLAEQFPEVYETCEYHLIDLSPYVIPIQRKKLINHMNHVHLHHISIHNWRQLEPRRCFVLGIELLSNMPHDYITWTPDGTTYEQWVLFGETDNLSMAEEKLYQVMDPIILRYLRCCNWMHEESFNNLRVLCLTDGQTTVGEPKWKMLEPTYYDSMLHILAKSYAVHNPFRIAWLPIGQMLMLEVLSEFFPRHHAFFADWNSVQHALMGVDGPLVQSKVRVAKDVFIRRTTDHLMNNAGMVDVCFPTDFDRMADVYKNICGEHKEIMHMASPDFWKTHGGEKTALFSTQSGWNPMLEDFAMFSVFATNHPAEM